MNQRLADALNPLLAIFGRKIIRSYTERWYGDPIQHIAYPIGWRIAYRNEYEGVADHLLFKSDRDAIEFQHFLVQMEENRKLQENREA